MSAYDSISLFFLRILRFEKPKAIRYTISERKMNENDKDQSRPELGALVLLPMRAGLVIDTKYRFKKIRW